MRIGILGSGGREHALAWALARGGATVFSLPGNGGTASNVAVNPGDPDDVLRACREQSLDLVVVGPEAPLAAGIADRLRAAGYAVVGPGQDGARLESSKVHAKDFMRRHGIPTAAFEVVDRVEDAIRAARWDHGFVLKADGLAAGKGVIVCRSAEEMDAAWRRLHEICPGKGATLVEERLEGWELSIHAVTDGTDYVLLPSSQDHKPLLDGDRGPNTGGMGAFCPVPACTDDLLRRIRREVIEPTLDGLRADGVDYRGILYAGLMITPEGPQVLEYNVRLGDPETEVLLPAIASDPVALFLACAEGRLADETLTLHDGYFVDVVLASEGYPQRYPSGFPIIGLDAAPTEHGNAGAWIFHAGTQRDGDWVLTAGGRVLNVVAHALTLDEAIDRAYALCDCIDFEGKTLRRDIGRRTAE